MNDEYISRDELRKHLADCMTAEFFDSDMKKAVVGIDVYVENMPAADVQPVIHSRWIPTGDGTYNAYCENCGQERGSKSWNKKDFKYCFRCGARMDGDSE